MRLKLKYALPLVQTLVAVALLVWTDRWETALTRLNDMPGAPPSFTLLIAINAPLAMPRALVFPHLPGLWRDITFVLAIAVLWYWVALNIESWQQRRRFLMFSWTPLRLLGDMIGVGTGLMCALVLSRDFVGWRDYGFPPVLSLTGWLWFILCTCLPILWSVVLIVLFTRDFIYCLLPPKPSQAASD
ncbi:MAG: hypothetical protein ABSB39_08150 [Candidatus Sulfotelmatobacter sp.]|jgi:hypothetical protein